MAGKLIIIFGPSGSGKGDIIAHIKAIFPEIIFPVSLTTRTPRPGEQDGNVYHFVSNEEFDAKVEAGEFLEWASFGGNRYGTLKSAILDPLEEGKLIVRELEIQGIQQLRTFLPEKNIEVIFIDAGSWEELEARVRARAPISEEELAKRKVRYEEEKMYSVHATHVVHNPQGQLESAKEEMIKIIQSLA